MTDLPETDLAAVVPDVVFDGGDLDCGSGLVLLIRDNMRKVPDGGVLEMKSREPTVTDDLPPWCRMVGHVYLGNLKGPDTVRHFVRHGGADRAREEAKALDEDKRRAKEYAWRLRIRVSGRLTASVYCRNFSWKLGQPASFEEKDAHPSAVEALLGALGSCLAVGFSVEAARRGLSIDDIELTVSGRLCNVLAHLGLEDGDPALGEIAVKCFASTMDDESAVRQAWDLAVSRSPVAATLAKAATLTTILAIV